MEKKLSQLFDAQRFESNPALQRIIDETHARVSRRALSLDEAEMVSAAGAKQDFEKKENEDK